MAVDIRNIVMLQGAVIIYTISGIMSKNASANSGEPVKFLFFLFMDFFFLGVYAILWQQMIKRFELSAAYANRSMAIVWSMIWAVVFFHDEITVKNIIGVLFIVIGTLVINTDLPDKTGTRSESKND